LTTRETALNRTSKRAKAGVSLFRSTGWLAQTSPDFQDALLATLHWKVAEPGTQISRAGDQQGGLVGVAMGIAEVSTDISHPDARFLHFTNGVFWLGYRPILGKPRNITLTARTELLWALAPQHAIEKVLHDHPQYWRHIAELSDLACEATLEVVVDLTRHDGLLRLVATLLRLGGCRYPDRQASGPQAIQISQHDLAGIAVMSRNTAGTHLSKLAKLGLIEVDYRSIRLLDPDRLRSLIDHHEE
jgi:CRP-like cAMP-binding protein